MSNDTARALGAKSPMVVKFGDKECQVRPLGIQELAEVEQDCLARYRRSYLETWHKNADLLPNGAQILQEKMEEAARWDVEDLPTKRAYDGNSVCVTKQLRQWVGAQFEIEDVQKVNENRIASIAASCLDQGLLSEAKYKELTGKVIIPEQIAYVNWWITGAYDGMITMTWICFKKYGITREEVSEKLCLDRVLMAEVAREIERVSAPAVGNG